MPRAAYDVEPAGAADPEGTVETKEGHLARAKQTGRAEARRKYRQSNATTGEDDGELDGEELEAEASTAKRERPGGRTAQSREAAPASGRVGFTSSFRAAYHPANLREDLRALPMLLRSRALLFALGALLAGVAVASYFRNYTGGLFALQLVVAPGSALMPQLVAGFFAPRASYLLGLIVGLAQGIVFMLLINLSLNGNGPLLLGDGFTQAEYDRALQTSFLEGPITSMLFAAAAAWYRRFLALSSSRRAGAQQPRRGTAKSSPSRRPAGR